LERRPRHVEDLLDVLEHLPRLCAEVALPDHVPVGVHGDLTGEVQEIAHPHPLAEGEVVVPLPSRIDDLPIAHCHPSCRRACLAWPFRRIASRSPAVACSSTVSRSGSITTP